jgi:hypothetical protein
MYKRPVLLVVALCAIGFLAGFYLGQAPLRHRWPCPGEHPETLPRSFKPVPRV